MKSSSPLALVLNNVAKMRLWLLLGVLLTSTAYARLNIEITQGEESALPIAVVPFAWNGSGTPPQDVSAIVSADLARSGQFVPLPLDQLPQQPTQAQEINFGAWQKVNADNLVIGRVAAQGDNYQVQFQLFDTVRGVQLAGYSMTATAPQLRRIAHQIADIIYQRLTGQRGAFDTHIAYVTVQDVAPGKRRYRLNVADSDGYNEQVILTSSKPLMSPAWSPDGKQLAYVSFEEGHSAIYIQDIASGKRKKVADFHGINGAPAFSHDGTRLAFTSSRDGNSEIYVMTLATGQIYRITHNYAIDTEPTWSPDDHALAFTSDRGGSPQIYEVHLDDAGHPVDTPQRLTFDGNYNARPRFSPDGKLIAMVHADGSAFRIAVLDLASGELRVLTDTHLDESPSFAPNGSMLLYATDINDRGVLAAVSVDGRVHQRLALKNGDVREPAWSPFFDQ